MSAVDRRKAWARRFIVAGRPDVLYGSPEWLALPDGQEKWAAAMRAAECWATEGDELEERLRRELDYLPLARKRADDQLYVQNRDEWRRNWTGRGFRPDPAIAADVEREWREWVDA